MIGVNRMMKAISSFAAMAACAIAFGGVASAAPSSHPHGAYAGKRPIKFPANHGSPVQLLSADAIAQRENLLLKPNGGSLKSSVLQTYATLVRTPNTAQRLDTDPLRDVYVVTSSLPNGLLTRHAKWSRATVVSVYDAATGTLLQRAVSGAISRSFAPRRP